MWYRLSGRQWEPNSLAERPGKQSPTDLLRPRPSPHLPRREFALLEIRHAIPVSRPSTCPLGVALGRRPADAVPESFPDSRAVRLSARRAHEAITLGTSPTAPLRVGDLSRAVGPHDSRRSSSSRYTRSALCCLARLRPATVSPSFHVLRCPPQTIDRKRPNVTNPMRRFAFPSRDVPWLLRLDCLDFSPARLGNPLPALQRPRVTECRTVNNCFALRWRARSRLRGARARLLQAVLQDRASHSRTANDVSRDTTPSITATTANENNSATSRSLQPLATLAATSRSTNAMQADRAPSVSTGL